MRVCGWVCGWGGAPARLGGEPGAGGEEGKLVKEGRGGEEGRIVKEGRGGEGTWMRPAEVPRTSLGAVGPGLAGAQASRDLAKFVVAPQTP